MHEMKRERQQLSADGPIRAGRGGARDSFVVSCALPRYSLWETMEERSALFSFVLEITARCNNNCRHCYINLPEEDREAKEKEISLPEIRTIADEAVSLGAVWCVLTGGEPLLRRDFADIYMALKRKGLLVSVSTNATLVNADHIRLFKKYPPRDVEVSVYGVTAETYERLTRRNGSFDAFMTGVNRLLRNGVKVRLKTMAIRSNVHELPAIARFCRERTKDYFRYDPGLHLRYDGNPVRNAEIRGERLTPSEIASLESQDPERSAFMAAVCREIRQEGTSRQPYSKLLDCGAGRGMFSVSYDGIYRLCSTLCHPDCVYDLKEGSVRDAWLNFVPRIRQMNSTRPAFVERCRSCEFVQLCTWCPAYAYLETGALDRPVDYFCAVSRARERAMLQRLEEMVENAPAAKQGGRETLRDRETVVDRKRTTGI